MNARRHIKFVREGSYAAEVDVELIEDDNGWSPYLSVEDAKKLDEVREALRRGDLKSAAKLGRVFRLTPEEVSRLGSAPTGRVVNVLPPAAEGSALPPVSDLDLSGRISGSHLQHKVHARDHQAMLEKPELHVLAAHGCIRVIFLAVAADLF